jgi:hypothetical protein
MTLGPQVIRKMGDLRKAPAQKRIVSEQSGSSLRLWVGWIKKGAGVRRGGGREAQHDLLRLLLEHAERAPARRASVVELDHQPGEQRLAQPRQHGRVGERTRADLTPEEASLRSNTGVGSTAVTIAGSP